MTRGLCRFSREAALAVAGGRRLWRCSDKGDVCSEIEFRCARHVRDQLHAESARGGRAVGVTGEPRRTTSGRCIGGDLGSSARPGVVAPRVARQGLLWLACVALCPAGLRSRGERRCCEHARARPGLCIGVGAPPLPHSRACSRVGRGARAPAACDEAARLHARQPVGPTLPRLRARRCPPGTSDAYPAKRNRQARRLSLPGITYGRGPSGSRGGLRRRLCSSGVQAPARRAASARSLMGSPRA
jgi:hypothetical protein